MSNTKSTGLAAIDSDKIEHIAINQRAGVWRVARNGKFYGDYLRRYWALDAAFELADKAAASGGGATITWTIDAEHDVLLYDTRALPRASRPNARLSKSRAKPLL